MSRTANQQKNIYATRERHTTNNSEMRYYEQVLSTEYTYNALGTIDSITLSIEQGARIIQVEKGIQPLFNSDWSYNSTSRVLTLLNGIEMGHEETLYIIYAVIRTS